MQLPSFWRFCSAFLSPLVMLECISFGLATKFKRMSFVCIENEVAIILLEILQKLPFAFLWCEDMLIGLTWSKKSSVMATPKHLGAHIWQIYPLGQSSIDALNTVTPNLADLPPSIKHRCLEYHYTKLGRSTPHQPSIDALNTVTQHFAVLPPGQLSIDALITITPHLADLPPKSAMHHGIYIMGCIWQPFLILQEKVGISIHFCMMRVVISQLTL